MRLRDLGLAFLMIALLVAAYESGQAMFVLGAAAVVLLTLLFHRHDDHRSAHSGK